MRIISVKKLSKRYVIGTKQRRDLWALRDVSFSVEQGEILGISDFIDVPVKRYSSGMYLRLAFSVAVNMRPDILLADEVLAVGDIEFQERCLERVKQAGESGMSVLFVSHDMDAITRLCDRVMWINAGQVVKIGTPDEVVTEYQKS